MTPLLNNIRYNKRKVSVITVGNKYNDAICSFSDDQIKYEEIIKLNEENLYIYTLQEKIKKNLNSYFAKNKSNFESDKNKPDSVPFFKHTLMEYFCQNQEHQCCLMIYEVYNCIELLAEKQDILFYNYDFKGKSCIGICPISGKDFLKTFCEIKEEDFFEPNIAKMRDDLYNKYRNPKTS